MVKKHEKRLRFEVGIGKAPALSDDELMEELRREARTVEREMVMSNKHKLENLLSDLSFLVMFVFLLVKERAARGIMFRAASRFWLSGMSDTAKAFVLISIADIVMGYHSEEGWLTAIDLIVRHYGWEVDMEPRYIFTAIVPVTLDACFKLYLFTNFNKVSPSTVATIREMDRH